jgi:SAM-dependent methyltransferase
VPCLVCNAQASRSRFRKNGYEVRVCGGCGLQYVEPTPSSEQLAHHYNTSYTVDFAAYTEHMDDTRLDELESWQSPGRLLEVGASYGHWLALARERGWEPTGVELSAEAAKYAREKVGVDVITSNLLDATLPGPFDAVVMWHVLEHTREPNRELERAAELLRVGGVLGLRVPNGSSFGLRFAGAEWPWMDPPAHLWFFDRSNLTKLLGRCGFDVLAISTARGDGHDPYFHLALAALKVAKRARRARGSVSRAENGGPVRDGTGSIRRRREAVLAALESVTPRLAAWTGVTWLESTGGLGDELICYARRAKLPAPKA